MENLKHFVSKTFVIFLFSRRIFHFCCFMTFYFWKTIFRNKKRSFCWWEWFLISFFQLDYFFPFSRTETTIITFFFFLQTKKEGNRRLKNKTTRNKETAEEEEKLTKMRKYIKTPEKKQEYWFCFSTQPQQKIYEHHQQQCEVSADTQRYQLALFLDECTDDLKSSTRLPTSLWTAE